VQDVASGAVVYLGQHAGVTSLLGSFSLTDPNVSNQGRPWLFSDNSPGVLATLEGSSAAAIVCSDFGGWAVPEPFGTLRFRRLRVDIWIDPARDGASNVTESSSITANRGMAVFAAVQFVLQRTDADAVFWGDMCTNDCHLLTEPQFLPVPDGDMLLRGSAYYGVSFTGWSDAAS
jgi:hypothetical protein